MTEEIKRIIEELKDNIPIEECRSEGTSDGLTHYEEDKDSWQYKLFDYITNLQQEIERLNNIINELEEYHIKSMKNLENTEAFKYVGTNHIKILYEEHKRTLDKLKELKESGNNE